METILELSNVSRRISDAFALETVTLNVRPGEIVGFVGPNGAGKTTVIRAALGLLHLDAGEICLFGEPFGANADPSAQRKLRARVGVVFDTCPFPADITVKQAAACIAPVFPRWSAHTFAALLDAFGLSPKAKIRDLSRGMGMKLQLACALSHDADLLILDEATAGLDPIARDQVLDRLREFAIEGQRGVLLSSHITSDLERVADRIVGINAGSIAFDVPREDITDRVGIAHCAVDQVKQVLDTLSDPDGGEEPTSPCAPAARAAAHVDAPAAFAISTPRAIRRAFCTDVLVADRFAFAEAFPEIPCDRANVDDYLQFALNGKQAL